MFQKLRMQRLLRVQADSNSLNVGFTGRVARIAQVHQQGLKDRAARGAPDVEYHRRRILGFSDADRDLIRKQLFDYIDA